MDYYIDILEPHTDLNKALDELGASIGVLYAEAWKKTKQHLYSDKPFNLHIAAFADMWFNKAMKVFVVRDAKTKEAVGFLTGVSFRPMPYESLVFQVQEWYTRGNTTMESDLFRHVMGAVRVLGCDEVWVQHLGVGHPDLGEPWQLGGEFHIRRFIKQG